MARNERSIRAMAGALLAVATLATRVPFRSHTLFEFDSIDFAVATFRFDLHEVTPHMPGYILHVWLGRLFSLFTRDINAAFVWLSVALSVGAVLFLWRAAAQLRGERVAIIAAAIWLTLPLFWFHGCVSSIYVQEAFWTSAILYFGIRFLNTTRSTDLIGLAITYSLAGAARPNDLLFFLPAIILLLLKVRPDRKHVLLAVSLFLFVTALWIGDLLREAGGLANYFAAARSESNYRTLSLFFGGTLSTHWDMVLKLAFYFAVSIAVPLVALLPVVILFPHHLYSLTRYCFKNAKAQFVILIAGPALAFYALIFFMKAGYLLNVLPGVVLIVAVTLDQSAIWFAERTKRRDADMLRLTRPIISRNVSLFTASVALLNVFWFFVRWPGTEQTTFNNENTRNSFVHGALNRYEQGRIRTALNRAFEYTNVSGIEAVDRLNEVTDQALEAAGAELPGTVIIANWWARWCYDRFPHATVIDIETVGHDDSLAVGVSYERERENISSKRFGLFGERVLLLMRHDRPDFSVVANQLHLERLPLPEFLDAYRIEDSTFHLRWGGREFVRRPLIPRSVVPLVDTLRMPMPTPLKRADDSGSR